MNKNLYRIVFNKHRGQLMAVPEHATAAGKASSGETNAPSSSPQARGFGTSAVLRLLCASVLASMGLFTVGSAFAQVIADPSAPGNQRPTVLQTTNGLPQINIQTPSATGVSRNTYRQFDVLSNGAILNNSRTNTQTQLGGWVQGNPWLATGSARIIVNEVNSANPSQLRGYIEIAGQRAEVIIANPAGVNADGAGFINANRVTLTTGAPQYSGGNLDGFLVQRGTVSINGQGLDATLTDYTGILARAIEINAGIWAKDLKVVAGANRVSADHTTVAAATGSGAAPTFALDVGQLGGMYAGKITLLGTESGVGVRNAGVIGATAGDVVLQADGWLTNSGSIQASGGGNAQISVSGDVIQSGTVYAAGNSNISSRGNIGITGVVAAQNHTSVLASGGTSRIEARSSAVLASGLNADGTLRAAGDLQVQASTLVANQGISASGGNTAIKGSEVNLSGADVSGAELALSATNGDLSATNANITAQGALTLQTPQTLRTDGARVTANQLLVSAHDLSNIAGKITQSGAGELRIQLPGTLNNTQGTLASNGQNFAIGVNTVTNTDGKIEHAGIGTLAIDAQTIISGQRGQITGNGALSVTAESLDHRNASSIAQQVSITTANLDNTQGEITQLGNGESRISASQRLDNTAGRIQTNGAATISTATLINNQGRVTSALGASVTASSSLNNTDGTIAAEQNLSLEAGNTDNTRGVVQALSGNATLHVADLNNSAGSVLASGNLNITAANVTNSGSLYAAGNQTLRAGGSVDNSGMLAAQGDVTVNANTLTSGTSSLLGAGVKSDGSLANTGELNVVTTQALAANGQNLAAGNALLSGASVTLSGSETSAANLSVTSTGGDLSTSNASVTTPGTLALSAQAQNTQSWSNNQGSVNAGQLNIQVANLNNAGGSIVQTGTGATALSLTSPAGVLDNTSGRIAVNSNNFTLGAHTLTNVNGSIEHAGTGTLAINAVSLNGQGGQITGNGALDVAAGAVDHRSASTVAQRIDITAASIDNRQGAITQLGTSPTGISVAQALDNRGGSIAGNGNINVSVQSLNNQGGELRASGASHISITATGMVDNSAAGNIAAGGNASITSNTLINDQGQITAGGMLNAGATQSASNVQGLMAANGNATVVSGALNNTTGTVASVYGDLNVTATGGTLNDSGKLQAAGDLTLSGGSLSNTRALGQTTAGNVTGRNVAIDTHGLSLNNQLGTIAATQSANLQTGALNNTSGLVQAGTTLVVNTHGQSLSNSTGAIISSGTTALNSGTLNNTTGVVAATGLISGSTGQIDNTAGGQIVGESDINLTIAGLNNQGGQVQAMGDATLNAGAGLIDNRSSLVRAGGAVSLTASAIDNRNTLGANQGIEGFDVTLNASLLNNTLGAVRAGNNTTVANANSVNNSQGLLSAGSTLSIQDFAASRALAITNTGGTLIAGQNNTLRAASLSGDGRVLSQQDLTVELTSDYTHQAGAEITADGNATLTTTGNLTNNSKLQAGNTLAIGANNIDNRVSGDINAFTTKLTATNTLTNRGVIDGVNTEINAATLNNLGTGRIYGDYMSIGVTTLNNTPEGGVAPTIAARSELDIGALTINNGEHALLFSAGDLYIGGSLDANRQASDWAGTVNNASATIEALGYLSLSAAQVNNLNNHFSTAMGPVSSAQSITEYQGDGSPNRYLAGTPGVEVWNKGESDLLRTPENPEYQTWTQYDYTRTTQQSVVTSSDPGRIIAGGGLTINATTVLNENSHIIAGGALTINAVSVQNPQTIGQLIIHDIGTVTSVSVDHQKGGRWDQPRHRCLHPAGYHPDDHAQRRPQGSVHGARWFWHDVGGCAHAKHD